MQFTSEFRGDAINLCCGVIIVFFKIIQSFQILSYSDGLILYMLLVLSALTQISRDFFHLFFISLHLYLEPIRYFMEINFRQFLHTPASVSSFVCTFTYVHMLRYKFYALVVIMRICLYMDVYIGVSNR